MMFPKIEHRDVPLQRAENPKWKCEEQREKISRIDARETSLPEFTEHDVSSGVGIDEDEAGKNEEETHPDIADSGECRQPAGAANDTDFLHVEECHVKSGEEPYRRQRWQSGARGFKAHKN